MHSERTVVVTGGASGIGLGVAQLFAKKGHPIAMLDVQESALELESAALRATGARVLARKVDVRDRASLDAAYRDVREELGPIAIVIANAGVATPADFLTLSIEAWQQMIDINLTGVFHTIQAALPDMVAKQWGRIVTISSQAAQSGAPDRAHYAASKAGVIGLTRSLGRELARHGITVNTIPPSIVDTPLARRGVMPNQAVDVAALAQRLPIARPGTPADIAAGCEYLCSEAAGYITGQCLNINGGAWMT